MAVYELRTYTLTVGKMAEATRLYQEFGFPALQKGGHDGKLVGYFQADTGMINQLVHRGNSTTTPTGANIGRASTPTRTSWRALPQVPAARHVAGGQAADRRALGSHP